MPIGKLGQAPKPAPQPQEPNANDDAA
jgi:hypothetical protein